MHIEQITNLQALAFVGGLGIFAWIVLRLVPSSDATIPHAQFSMTEITAYDRKVPLYFLAAALALIVGGLHTVVKNVPAFWQWLWEAGYGGHLFRDLANTHIIIVGGGTVLLTGITWYLLPRLVNRPLYSPLLASMSFWFTVTGVFGFYLSWLVLGLIEGSMIRQGWVYLDAKAAMGNWHKIPTAVTSSIMGMGYWTYVLNVFLTVLAARRVDQKPLGYLTKFAVVSAGALFVGTVQGVIQVLPASAEWINKAGKYGQYVDPISHAHINLVTGMMVSLAAFLIYFAPRMGGKPLDQRAANRIFWILVPGSLAFYLSFLLSGLILGGAVNRYGGIQIPALVQPTGYARGPALAISGTLMLAGFWAYFISIWYSLDLRALVQHVRHATPAAFWLVSSLALLVGTFQGLLQVIPSTAGILTGPEEVPNIHAQINMIGGVVLALIGVVYVLLPELVGQPADQKLARVSLLAIAGGISGYYLVTLVSGLVRISYVYSQGMTAAQSAARVGWVAPALLFLTALPMLVGYLAFGAAVWRASAVYRAAWLADLRRLPSRYNGPAQPWRQRTPLAYFLGAEAIGALAGFPGLGWILSGHPMPGVPLALAGPMVAWAIVPVLISPYGAGPLLFLGTAAPLIYMVASTLLSVTALGIVLNRRARTGVA